MIACEDEEEDEIEEIEPDSPDEHIIKMSTSPQIDLKYLRLFQIFSYFVSKFEIDWSKWVMNSRLNYVPVSEKNFCVAPDYPLTPTRSVWTRVFKRL